MNCVGFESLFLFIKIFAIPKLNRNIISIKKQRLYKKFVELIMRNNLKNYVCKIIFSF